MSMWQTKQVFLIVMLATALFCTITTHGTPLLILICAVLCSEDVATGPRVGLQAEIGVEVVVAADCGVAKLKASVERWAAVVVFVRSMTVMLSAQPAATSHMTTPRRPTAMSGM